MMLRFLDTNILLYSISRDPTETTKRDRAVALIDGGGNALAAVSPKPDQVLIRRLGSAPFFVLQ
jgi:predicted nucleic acid-binding protein